MNIGFSPEKARVYEWIHSLDWTENPLGSPESWSPVLRTTINLLSLSPDPILVVWGEERILLYNTTFSSLLEDSEACLFGKSIKANPDSIPARMLADIEEGFDGQIVKASNIHFTVNQKETYYNFSVTPIIPDDEQVEGIYCTGMDVSKEVIAERRQDALQDLALKLTQKASSEEILDNAISILQRLDRDLPFSLIYKVDPTGHYADLIKTTGIGKTSPLYRKAYKYDKDPIWPITSVIAENRKIEVYNLHAKAGPYECGPYPESPDHALAMPLYISEQNEEHYVMIAGISAHLDLDMAYKNFLDQIRLTLCTAIQRSKSEEAYIKSKTVYRSIVQNTAVGIAEIDQDWIVTYVNDRFGQIAGTKPEQVVHRHIKTLIDPSDYSEIYPHLQLLFQHGKPVELERNMKRAGSKKPLWVFTSLTPISNEEGVVVAATVTVLDLSKQKRIEDTLRKSKSKLSGIFSHAAVGICEISRDGKFLNVNKHLCKMLGRSRKELLSSTVSDITHPDDIYNSLSGIEKLLETGEQITLNKRYMRADGSIMHATSTLTLLNETNYHEETVLVVTVDTTDIVRHERNVRLIANLHAKLAMLSSPEDILEASADLLSDHFDTCNMTFLTVDETPEYATVIYEKYQEDASSVAGKHLLANFMTPDYLNLLSSGKVMAVNDIETDPHLAPLAKAYESLHVKSQLHAPYISDGKLKFLLSMMRPEISSWKDEEIDLIHQITARIYVTLERAYAEKALRESENRYKTLFNSIDEGFCVIEVIFDEHNTVVDYKFLEVNPAFIKLTGFENAVGKSMKELNPNVEVEDYWGRIYGEIVLKGKPKRFTNLAKTFGTWYDVYAFPYGDINNREVGVIFNDITERKENEEALRRSESKYRTLFNSMDEGFCIIEMIYDKSGRPTNYRFLETNPAFAKQTGLEDAKGKSIRELLPEVEPRWMEIYHEVTESRVAKRNTLHIETPDGERWFEVFAFPYGDPTSKLIGVVFNDSTMRHINEEALRRSEEHLQRIMESAKDYAIFTLDKQGLVLSWNAGAENIFGYTEAEMLGKSGDILFLPEERNWAPDREVYLANKTGNAKNERWHIRKDGTRFWGSGLMMPLLDAQDNNRGYLKIMRDFTEQRKLEKQLKEAREREMDMVKADNRRKDEFMSIASHELRTPLTSLQAYVQLLYETSDKLDQATIKNYIGKLDRATGRIAALVKELLDASRIKSGKIEYNFALFHFGEMVDESIEMAQHYTYNHQIIPVGEITESIYGDRDRLQQVVNNLLSNAIKYSPEGGNIYVYMKNSDDNIQLSVTDSGLGIPGDKLESIFQSYSRVDTGHQISGMGLGLYIAAEVIRRHHGKIWAESILGKGSAFHFTIPKRPNLKINPDKQ